MVAFSRGCRGQGNKGGCIVASIGNKVQAGPIEDGRVEASSVQLSQRKAESACELVHLQPTARDTIH